MFSSLKSAASILYSWEIQDGSGHWRRLEWKMTDEEAVAWALLAGAEARKIAKSAEPRVVPAVRPILKSVSRI